MNNYQADPPALPRVAENRRASKWTRRELAKRILWSLTQPLFRWSPRPTWGWRRLLLRIFGATVGWEARVHPTVLITMPWNLTLGDYAAVGDRAILYALGPISIGASATISQNAHICAGSHDYRRPNMPLLKLPISIGNGAWICADAFVGPGVDVGVLAIVGARAVVTKNVTSNTIVAGNPAKQIGVRLSAPLI